MGELTAHSFALICLFVVMVSFAQILMKLGVGSRKIVSASPAGTLANILNAAFRPLTMAGLLVYVAATLVWLFVLSRVPLSVAYPMMSMSYFLVVILSATLLKERVDWRLAAIGLVLISGGVTCIGLGMG